MQKKPTTRQQLLAENAALRARLDEAEATLRAIQSGEADALVLSGSDGDRIFPRSGALEPYRVMIEAMGEGALALQNDGTILYGNNRFAEWVKLPREAVTGMALQEMIAKKERERFDALLPRGTEGAVSETLTLQAADGTQMPALFSFSPLPQSDGRVISVVIADLSDVAAVAAARSRLALIVDSSDDAIVSTTPEGVVESWNRAAEKLYGYSAEEAYGRSIDALIVPPERINEVVHELEAIRQGEHTLMEETLRLRKDGTRVDVSIKASPVLDDAGTVIGASINARDITERRRAKEALKKSEEKYRRLFENAQIGIFTTRSSDGKLVLANDAMAKMFGYDSSDEATTDFIASEHYVDPKQREQLIDTLRKHGRFDNFEAHLTRNDGVARWFLYSGKFGQNNNFIEGVAVDITERKQVEEQRELFRTLLDHSSDAIEVLEPGTLRFLDVNEAECRAVGYSREELLAMSAFDIDPEFTPEIAEAVDEQMRQEGSAHFETLHRRKDGSTFPVEVSTTLVELDRPYLLSIARDITERKQAEEVLLDEKAFSETLVQSLPDIFYLLDQQGNMIRWNDNLMELSGRSPAEMAAANALEFIVDEDKPLIAEKIREAFETGVTSTEARMAMKSGVRLYALNGTRIETMRGVNLIGIGIDITERKAAEEVLRRANRALKTLSAGNLALVRAASEDELLQEVTNVIVEQGGYSLAAVDYAEEDPQKSITPKAWSGFEEEHYWAEHLTWDDTERGQLPISKTIRSGETQVCHDIAGDPAFAPWRECAMQRGYHSNITLPLSDGKHIFGGLCIYSSDANAFDDEEVKLLEELANDLAYGIVTLRARVEHEQHALLLRQSLEQSIQTIAATVEARDPYTAGHQRRVGELSGAIAKEMGLPAEQVQGIHLAASIHDLGKIHIPAEILSRPGKITELEYMLIQTHPQAGYEILKDVAFPWPIAQIILQHHERLDGSGYPQGLKENEILLEAKIIAVADVVEAISSHRPYRPSMGIEPALEEITQGRGSAYDPAIVDACVKLFAENRFAFSSA